MQIKFGGDLPRNLKRATQRARNLSPPLKLIGLQMVKSTDKTFREEGRPKWVDLKDSTKAQRRRGPRAKRKIAILQDTGQLKRSITYEVVRPSKVRWGPNRTAPYGIFHVSSKPRKIIPLRQFLGLYPEDRKRIAQIIGKQMNFIMRV